VHHGSRKPDGDHRCLVSKELGEHGNHQYAEHAREVAKERHQRAFKTGRGKMKGGVEKGKEVKKFTGNTKTASAGRTSHPCQRGKMVFLDCERKLESKKIHAANQRHADHLMNGINKDKC